LEKSLTSRHAGRKALQGIQFAHDHRRLPACRMEKNFPPAAEIDPEYQKSLVEKWKKELFS
jgi:hypothetical protein